MSFDSASQKFTFSSDRPELEGEHELQYVIRSTYDSSFVATYDFKVTLLMSTCTKEFRIPSEPYSFDEATYVVDTGLMEVELADIDITDCPYRIDLWNVTNPALPQALNSSTFTLIPANLTTDPSDSMKVSV